MYRFQWCLQLRRSYRSSQHKRGFFSFVSQLSRFVVLASYAIISCTPRVKERFASAPQAQAASFWRHRGPFNRSLTRAVHLFALVSVLVPRSPWQQSVPRCYQSEIVHKVVTDVSLSFIRGVDFCLVHHIWVQLEPGLSSAEGDRRGSDPRVRFAHGEGPSVGPLGPIRMTSHVCHVSLPVSEP